MLALIYAQGRPLRDLIKYPALAQASRLCAKCFQRPAEVVVKGTCNIHKFPIFVKLKPLCNGLQSIGIHFIGSGIF